MHSLKTRITLLTVCMILIAVSIVTVVSVFFIRTNGRRQSDQLLLLLCDTGERNLDYYFDSVQKSVRKVASFVEGDLNGLDDQALAAHMERVGPYFEELAYRTNGVLTYYYRIDPEVSEKVKGFWYTNMDGNGFREHQVTDITRYDTQDTSKLVWFTVPKHTGQPIWLPPYITDNLDWRVISYNVPIYWKARFVGVVGIEIDYSTMAEQVESIRLYNSGFAFLNNDKGELFFHPRIDVATLGDDYPIPRGVVSDSTFFRYTYEGVEKQAAWLPLSNGMRLNVCVPVAETVGDWQTLIRDIIVISVLVLFVLSIFTLFYTNRISKPLRELTEAAKQVDQGNYDFTLEYSGDDEVGRLTNTFKTLTDHMKKQITDLNTRVYVDALTSVKNKGAFNAAVETLQGRLDGEEEKKPAFAVGVFDCDNLKVINDRYGHDKGDIYLKAACGVICRVFQHSPVYRIGGDEFSVILQGQDYENRAELVRRFELTLDETCAKAVNKWEQARITMGLAVYSSDTDKTAIDTVRRADSIMYANKRARKTARRR